MLSNSEPKSILTGVRKGNHRSFSDLSEMYRPLIESFCRKFASSLEEDEVRQICSIALYKAACSFDTEQEKVTFGAYASVCMKNAVIGELRRIRPTEQYEESDTDEENNLIGTGSPEDELIAREGYDELTKKIRELLSPYEMQIFGLYLSGKTYAEMAQAVRKSEKSVGTAVMRARAKLRRIIKD